MEKIDYRKMGMEIKIRRLRADISQSDLAKQIGVSQSHLCNVENGRLYVMWKMVACRQVYVCF